MTFRRLFLIAGSLLIFSLGVYTWNLRTRVLDDMATSVGLEATGHVLSATRSVQGGFSQFWRRYLDLVDVREENQRLKARITELEAKITANDEAMAELDRLRSLLQLPADPAWKPVGARVLAGRIGPNGVLNSITINRGHTAGGRPGTPLVTQHGLVGRILRASAHSATALLVTDPSSRIAVMSQKGRSPGILIGQGPGRPLEVNFMDRGADVKKDEILITSGLDGKYPKGIPAARVVDVAPSNYSQFLAVRAEPLMTLHNLEEVLMLEPSGVVQPDLPLGPPPVFVGPPAPDRAMPTLAPEVSGRRRR